MRACAGVMGEMGAEVLKVEQPGTGDFMREIGPFVEGDDGAGYSLFWAVEGRGRKSMTLAQQIYANDALAAEVKAVMVAFDYARQETREVPDGLRAELSGYLV